VPPPRFVTSFKAGLEAVCHGREGAIRLPRRRDQFVTH
jgi:hypothetical protein